MGCTSSTPVKEEDYKDNKQEFEKKHKIPANVEAALSQGQRRNVSFAGDVRDTPVRNASNNDGDAPSRAVSVSGRPRCVYTHMCSLIDYATFCACMHPPHEGAMLACHRPEQLQLHMCLRTPCTDYTTNM